MQALPELAGHPLSIFGGCGALLRVNRDIFQNVTKQRKFSFCLALKKCLTSDHTFFLFQHL